MEVKAKGKHIKMSARKLRLVADVIRGLDINKALEQLNFIQKLAVKPILKLMNSAIANARNNFELDKDNLYVKEIRVDEGSTLRRWTPKAFGRATPIRKRTSHINLVLAEIKDSGVKELKKQAIEAPVKLGSKPKEREEKIGVYKNKEAEKQIEPKKNLEKEKGAKIVDQRMESRVEHAKIEGKSHKGFIKKIFRRKSG